jgi:polyisoprenoid-binding protein YceI
MKCSLWLTAITLPAALLTAPSEAQERAAYSIDAAASRIEIDVYKEGLLKAFGHDHVILVRAISGSVEFDGTRVENSSVSLAIPAATLTVSDPGVSEKDRQEIQATMLSDEVLDVARFPRLSFTSTGVSAVQKTADGWHLTLTGDLTLHGVSKRITLPLQVHANNALVSANGEISLQQTDYGITPVKAAGGSVKVKDRLKIIFAITARSSQ